MKIFRTKNGLPRPKSSNSETKTDIVMSKMGKMVVTHRATKVPLTKIWFPRHKNRNFGKNVLLRADFWLALAMFSTSESKSV